MAARVEKLSSFNAFHFEPETVSDYPSGCPDRNTFTAAETEVKPDIARKCVELVKDMANWYQRGGVYNGGYASKAAALFPEQELASIRAELERSAK